MSRIVVAPPRRERIGDTVRVLSAIEGRAPLWFTVPVEFEDLLSDRADFALLGLLLPAMKYREDLHVGGVVTDTLLHRVGGELQDLLCVVDPIYSRVRITADEVSPAPPPAAGVATGFSCGVDSLAVLSEFYLADDVPAELRITHLILNNVGSHGGGGEDLWRERCRRLQPIAKSIGLPFVPVNSNLEAHHPRMAFARTVTARNAAVAHLLAGGIGRLHYAAAFSYSQIHAPVEGEISRVDPMSLPLLSTRAVALTAAGTGRSRTQKTLALIGRPEARWLDVCTNTDPGPTGNCGECPKCMRTMLTLEMAGHLDEFCPVPFPPEPYRARRGAFIARLLASHASHDKELVEYARGLGWRWGARARVLAAGHRLSRLGARSMRAARRAIRVSRRALLRPRSRLSSGRPVPPGERSPRSLP